MVMRVIWGHGKSFCVSQVFPQWQWLRLTPCIRRGSDFQNVSWIDEHTCVTSVWCLPELQTHTYLCLYSSFGLKSSPASSGKLLCPSPPGSHSWLPRLGSSYSLLQQFSLGFCHSCGNTLVHGLSPVWTETVWGTGSLFICVGEW